MGFPDPSCLEHLFSSPSWSRGGNSSFNQQNPRLGTSSLCNLGSKALGATVWEPQGWGVWSGGTVFFLCFFSLNPLMKRVIT